MGIYIAIVAAITLATIVLIYWGFYFFFRRSERRYRHCSRGHTEFSILSHYCSKCGEKLPEYKARYCPVGHPATDSDIYCTECGRKIE